jgi:hypothetical protein
LCVFCLYSCNSYDDADVGDSSLTSVHSDKDNVTLSDVKNYTELVCVDDSDGVTKIVPIVVDEMDTLAYIVNYLNGWEIIGGDKRITPILAYDNSGNFDVENANPNVIAWLEDMTDRIYAVRYGKTQDTLSEYCDFWENVSNRSDKISKSYVSTGQYKKSMLRSATTSVNHLIQTKWGQSSPWNTCVPYTTDYVTRCPVGCVAVAGAQMLYFLHYKLGSPEYMYSVGSCSGWANGSNYSYTFIFNNADTTIWNEMAKYYWNASSATNKSAILMGYVGYRIGMKYDDSSSGATTSDLVGDVFTPFGISCSYASYNATKIVSSLESGMPVIIRAYGTKTVKKFLGITIKTTYSNGHAWIIDGYESDGTDTYFKMNWGWDGSYDSGSYTNGDSWNIGSYNFVYERKMISGYSI